MDCRIGALGHVYSKVDPRNGRIESLRTTGRSVRWTHLDSASSRAHDHHTAWDCSTDHITYSTNTGFKVGPVEEMDRRRAASIGQVQTQPCRANWVLPTPHGPSNQKAAPSGNASSRKTRITQWDAEPVIVLGPRYPSRRRVL
jgi:hypothetical protein